MNGLSNAIVSVMDEQEKEALVFTLIVCGFIAFLRCVVYFSSGR